MSPKFVSDTWHLMGSQSVWPLFTWFCVMHHLHSQICLSLFHKINAIPLNVGGATFCLRFEEQWFNVMTGIIHTWIQQYFSQINCNVILYCTDLKSISRYRPQSNHFIVKMVWYITWLNTSFVYKIYLYILCHWMLYFDGTNCGFTNGSCALHSGTLTTASWDFVHWFSVLDKECRARTLRVKHIQDRFLTYPSPSLAHHLSHNHGWSLANL